MKTEDIIKKSLENKTDFLETGRDFYALSGSDKKTVLVSLLENKAYNSICKIINCGYINKQYINDDFLSSQNENAKLESRYFNLFLEIILETGTPEGLIYPMLIESFYAHAGEELKKWQTAIEIYMLNAAYKDYNKVLSYLTGYDKNYRCYHILIKADKQKTSDILINRLLFEKHINKIALRKFLLDYKIDVSEFLLPVYKEGGTQIRANVVRLLLLYKNDANCALMLEYIKSNEKSEKVKNIILKDSVLNSPEKTEKDPFEFFTGLMINGTEFDIKSFKKLILSSELNQKIASELFFSVVNKEIVSDIVVFEKCKICNLDNIEIQLPEECKIKITHVAEIPKSLEYIKRLNVVQHIDQIKRKTFFINDYEKAHNSSIRLSGTIILLKDLKLNIKKEKFKLIYSSSKNLYNAICKASNNVLMVINFNPIDFSANEQLIKFNEITFYNYKDVVKIGGKIFLENAPLKSINSIPVRDFSEFILSAYKVSGNLNEK